MLKSLIGLSIIASSVFAIDEVSVVENLSCKTFTTNDAVAGVYKYYNPDAKDWALYMPQIDYFLVHETGKALIAEGAETINSSDFSSIDSTGPIVLGEYTGTNTRADLLSNSTMSIADNVAGIYNRFDAANNLWFLYMPALDYLLVHETGNTSVDAGALNIDTAANFDNIEVNAATGAVTFIAKGGCGAVTKEVISAGVLTESKTLTADKVWLLDGKVEVPAGLTLTVEPGTTVAGKKDTNGWLLVHPGAQLFAEGTAAAPITFTSEEAVDGEAESFGQWGGVTLIGNAGNDQTTPYEVDGTVAGTGNDADSSGVLTYVTLNNTGVEVVINQEINGLSFVGVGSGTLVDNITVNRSGDDGVEIWGGTVNLTNIVIDGAQDDSFDTDEGWSGSVDGLTITNGVKAGIEMSGTTRATYRNVNITHSAADGAEGGIYFKPNDNQEIGGVFENVTITHNGTDIAFGAIHSREKPGSSIDLLTTFDNVTLAGTNPTKFSGPYATTLEALFDAGTGNDKGTAVPKEVISAGVLTESKTLTADKVWLLDGKVEVPAGLTLTVEPGTTVAGKKDTNGWLLVHPGAQLFAEGTAAAPITFTSEEAVDGEAESFGQWGGVTLIGNAGNDQTTPYEVDGTVAGTGNDADSSGVLTYVTLNNTGVEVVINQEINGLSFVGVGSMTLVDNITVNRSGDDGVEIWGGTVNLTNIVIDGAQDDSFDTDEGWSGSVDGLTITNGVKAGIEMSGTTRATYRNVNITHGAADGAEGGIYFKPNDNQEIGGVFENVTITHNGTDIAFGAIHSREKPGSSIDLLTTFDNVTLAGTNPTKFSGPYATTLEALFDAGTGNDKGTAVPKEVISAGVLTESKTLTADKVWLLDGKVEVPAGLTLTVEPGTTVAGKKDTNGWLLVHPGAQLFAEGTAAAPITFTSEEAVDGEAESFGQWGGVTLIGNAGNDQTTPYEVDGTVAGTGNDADSSGVLTYVTLNNTGVEVVINQEINGLSFVGVGSGTLVDNITVNRSGDDGVEIWGGTVNLTNIVIDGAQDDSFDTDEGWSGSVDGLTITNGVKAGIEMSGTTRATYRNVNITHSAADGAEGGIYFKPNDNQEIGGVFENVTITHNGTDIAFGAIHSREKPGSSIDLLTTFDNVTLAGTNPTKFSGPYATTLEALFDAGTGNDKGL